MRCRAGPTTDDILVVALLFSFLVVVIFLLSRFWFFIFNQRITALQCLVGFCHTVSPVSHGCIYI